jgi:hypothetical protein
VLRRSDYLLNGVDLIESGWFFGENGSRNDGQTDVLGSFCA